MFEDNGSLFYAPASPSLPAPAVRLILFQRDDCHLCELALDILARARVPEPESVFIDADDALEARYGARVPVLRDAERARELDWPFDAAMLARFLQAVPPAATSPSR